jgi:hypothetical protein
LAEQPQSAFIAAPDERIVDLTRDPRQSWRGAVLA